VFPEARAASISERRDRKVVWPWVNLAEKEISLPPGIDKHRKPMSVPHLDELPVNHMK